MMTSGLSLGPILFRDFEIPSSILFGGRQRLAVHRLSNGQRITDVLGPDDSDIKFQGILSGSSASTRSQHMDALRSIGAELILAWGKFKYSVVISDFEAFYQNDWWVPYRISCYVLENQNSINLNNVPSSAAQAIASIDILQTLVPMTLLPFSNLRTACVDTGITAGSSRSLANALAALQDSIEALGEVQQKAESVLSSSQIGRARSPAQVSHRFIAMSGSTELLQNVAVAQDYLGQSATYLNKDTNG